jgi:chromosome segregation protein
MTFIQKLVMNGFKSFAYKTELVMGTKFNCILGPNGSGKSNIMDALSFVLGKGSAKGMRAEKAANLIYNGGKNKEPAKQGEVSIYFDNGNKTFPTEEKSVKITRIVKNSGQSVYKINDKVRTRQQILDLLSISKINPDAYNIILQGDIARFVEMPPDERRRIIEQISGISIYEEKKQKAENELKKVEDKLNEAEIILNERRTSLDSLKQERDQALNYKNTQDKLKKCKATLLHLQIKEKELNLKKINENMSESSEKIKKLENEIEELNKNIQKLKSEEIEINKEIEEKGEKDQVDLHKDVENIKIDIIKNKTRIDSCENEIKRLNERKEQLNNNLKDLNIKIENANKEKKELEELKNIKEKDINSIIEKVKQYRKDNQLDNAGDVEQIIDDIDKKIDLKQHEIHELREKQQELMRNKDRFEYQIQSIDEKILKVKEVEKEYKNEIEAIKKERDELKKITLKLSKLLDENQSIVSQSTNARTKLEKIRDDLSSLNAKNMTKQQVISSNIAIQKIIESKNKFGKVYGTITDLATVKNKFSVALEIAAGPRLKSIVVEDDKVASECINYLKTNKLGSATFLPINKIKEQSINSEILQLEKSRGVLGRAETLLSYDPKFKKVFNYVFGNTLVVEDINTARRIGIGKARMATLTGDLTELSGAMHGGYKDKKSTLGFKEEELSNEIKDLEKKENDYQKLLSSLDIKRKDNEEEIIFLREKKANLEGGIIKKEKSLHLDSDDLKASVQLKEEFFKEIKIIEKELNEKINIISSINSELAKLKIEKQKNKDIISELRNPKKLAELNAFEQKRDELKQEIIKIDSEIKNTILQTNNILLPEKENILRIFKQHDKEEIDFKSEVKLLKDMIKKQNDDLKIKEVKEKEFKIQFKNLFSKKNNISNEINKNENNLKSKEKAIRDIEIKSNSFSIENARFGAELLALKEEFKQYENIEILNKNKENLKQDISKYEIEIIRIGSVNLKALDIYEIAEKEYINLNEKKEKLKAEKDDVLMMMNEIETKKKDLFMKAFEVSNQNFINIFKQLSSKGEAYLELENSDDPLSEGILIKVKITGKKYMDIRALSGGEKTMTALAFIFSIQEHDPASFYILDEVDAALDKRNAEKLAELINKYSDKAQYIIISHNDGVIKHADTLYGVSMNEHGISKVISLKV